MIPAEAVNDKITMEIAPDDLEHGRVVGAAEWLARKVSGGKADTTLDPVVYAAAARLLGGCWTGCHQQVATSGQWRCVSLTDPATGWSVMVMAAYDIYKDQSAYRLDMAGRKG